MQKKYLVTAGNARHIQEQLAAMEHVEAVLRDDSVTVEISMSQEVFARVMQLVCQGENQVQDIRQEGTQLETVYQDIFQEDA